MSRKGRDYFAIGEEDLLLGFGVCSQLSHAGGRSEECVRVACIYPYSR